MYSSTYCSKPAVHLFSRTPLKRHQSLTNSTNFDLNLNIYLMALPAVYNTSLSSMLEMHWRGNAPFLNMNLNETHVR